MDDLNAIEQYKRRVEMTQNIHIGVQRHRVYRLAELIANVEHLPPALRLDVHRDTLKSIDEIREVLVEQIAALEQVVEG